MDKLTQTVEAGRIVVGKQSDPQAEQIKQLEQDKADMAARLADVELALADLFTGGV